MKLGVFKNPIYYPLYLCGITFFGSSFLYIFKFGVYFYLRDMRYIIAYSVLSLVVVILLAVNRGWSLIIPYVSISCALGVILYAYYSCL